MTSSNRLHVYRTRLLACLTFLAALVLSVALPTTANAAEGTDCQGHDVAVGSGQTMHGTLCQPPNSKDAVVVLVPGATYDHTYWDFPFDPSLYNFRAQLNKAGYSTYVVDRLGTGHSSRPASATVTTTVQADAVHQTIQALRAGHVGGDQFHTVILGGHSLGSLISAVEAGTFNDEDGVLLSGYSHTLNPATVANITADSLYPADQDPALRNQGYDPGYLTTRPGTRGPDFYAPATTDPRVVTVDESTKSVVANGELSDGITVGIDSPFSRNIRHPVFEALGSLDGIFCATPGAGGCANSEAFHQQEANFFSPTADLHNLVVPNAGHDLNLETNTPIFQRATMSWLSTVVTR